MTSVRQVVKRLLKRIGEEEGSEEPAPERAYRFYWTKEAREWSSERRAAIRERVAAVIASDHFEPTTYERRYEIEGLDDSAHAGASLQALLTVLEGFEQFGRQAEEGGT